MSRRYSLTFFSKPDFKESESIVYFIAAEEVCSKTKKVHYQAYVSLSKKTRMKGLKTILEDQKVHVEKCKGNEYQNILYCKKGDQSKEEWKELKHQGPNYGKNYKLYREFGTPKKQGKRNDLLALRDAVMTSGYSKTKLYRSDSLAVVALKHPRAVNELLLAFSPERTTMTRCDIYWGATRTGKSKKALEEAKGDYYYKPVSNSVQWWDGYEQQKTVIIEDFRGEVSLAEMLRLCDRYPLRKAVKGGFVQFNSPRIIITSNLPPHQWWNQDQKAYEVNFEAFMARIKEAGSITEFKQLEKSDTSFKSGLPKPVSRKCKRKRSYPKDPQIITYNGWHPRFVGMSYSPKSTH